MLFKILSKKIKYDGSQLNPEFAYQNGLKRSGIIGFIGPAYVKEHLVDLEDKKNNDFIKSDSMLHFIITIEGNSIIESVLWQRLFIHGIASAIASWIKSENIPSQLDVRGDDILIDGGKLSVSIATVSPSKELIHIGLNWKAGKAPVKTFSLSMLPNLKRTNPSHALFYFIEKICSLYDEIKNATFKVKTF